MKHTILLTLSLLMSIQLIYAQKEKISFDEYKQYHHLQTTDSIYLYKFICEAKSSIVPDREKNYTWYYNNNIHTTAGNYSGKLLSGEYTKLLKSNNQLAEKGFYIEGLRTDKWFKWNPDGTLSEYTEYKKGMKNGVHITYADSNKYAYKGVYKNDEKTKIWIEYHNGKIQTETTYKENLKNGKQKIFDDNGNLIKVCHYKNGVLHGKSSTYNQNKKEKTEIFKNGEKVEPTTSDSFFNKIFKKKENANKNNAKKEDDKSKKADKSKTKDKKALTSKTKTKKERKESTAKRKSSSK